jgi:hypothetical protein
MPEFAITPRIQGGRLDFSCLIDPRMEITPIAQNNIPKQLPQNNNKTSNQTK